jgi:hypothetical protein
MLLPLLLLLELCNRCKAPGVLRSADVDSLDVACHCSPPSLPPQTAAAEEAASGDSLILNFSVPAQSIYRNKAVASVTIPVRKRTVLAVSFVCAGIPARIESVRLGLY